MRRSAALFSIFVLAGCLQPPRIETAPMADPVDTARIGESHSRVLPISRSAVFPKVLDLLLDQGFQVLSVDEPLGLVSFHQQWVDRTQDTKPILILEGTLVFREAAPGATKVRVEMSGRSETLVAGKGGAVLIPSVMQKVDGAEYRKLLDLLERGLR